MWRYFGFNQFLIYRFNGFKAILIIHDSAAVAAVRNFTQLLAVFICLAKYAILESRISYWNTLLNYTRFKFKNDLIYLLALTIVKYII